MQQGQCDALTKAFINAAAEMLGQLVKNVTGKDGHRYRVVRRDPINDALLSLPPLVWEAEFLIQERRGWFMSLFRGAWKDCAKAHISGHYSKKDEDRTQFVARAAITDLMSDGQKFYAKRSLRVSNRRRNPSQIRQAVRMLGRPLLRATYGM